MRLLLKYLLFILLPAYTYGQSGRPDAGITFEVTDSLHNPLAYATVALTPMSGGGKAYATTTDEEGRARFTLPANTYNADISYIGYVSQRMEVRPVSGSDMLRTVRLRTSDTQIREVVITATQVRGPVSGVHIGRDAMNHIQPSSFGDLLELLPGGRASDPSFSSSNHIHLREIGTSNSDYQTTSLGVSFVMDGIPMSNDAGMTYNSGTTVGNNISLNRGVDMRTMPTDEIASVEIQQGIPSVEYGDLTSGLIKIKRKEGGRNLEARFKADLGSQLLYVGKGFEWGAPADLLTMNVGATWLNSHDDPRNTRQNYQRATGSWRMKKRWESTSAYRYTLGGSLDYTGSFDRQKSDRDIDEGPAGIPLERYKSSYNNVVAAVNFTAESKGANFFRSFDFSASVSSEFDLIDRWRYRANSGNVPIRTAVEEGVFDMEVLPVRYEATLQVDNKPFYANAKAVALLGADTPLSRNTIRIGAEWNMSKNYGGGLLYDVTRPFTDLMSSHPRRYDALPALHRLSAFLEDNTTITAGEWRIEIMAGLRTTAMANLGSRYTLQGKFHFDPRANLSVTLPAFDMAGDPMRITFAGGAGWHTKTPTLDQLFPEPDYSYYTRLNYFPADDESKRRINEEVFKHDPTNYDLKAARNFKWEVRGNAEWNGYGLSVTYFRENMTSGFRTSTDVLTRTYREYDTGPLKDMEFTGPPQLEWLPYKDKTVFQTVGVKTNGSRTFKQGIEFSLSTRRIRALATKLIVSGAYFKTRYENSEPQYVLTTVQLAEGTPYPYIGLYDQDDNTFHEVCNTNFLLDTQIPKLGLIFSTSFQCQWFSGMKAEWCNPAPTSYLDLQLQEHPFTAESAADGILQHMIHDNVSKEAYLYRLTPFSMNVNLKISKRLYRDRLNIAIFVNRLFTYSPSSRNETNALVRRYSSPYFGMELNFKL